MTNLPSPSLHLSFFVLLETPPAFSQVYLYKKWKFKLIWKFVQKNMYTYSPFFYFPPLASHLYILPFPVCSVYTVPSFMHVSIYHYLIIALCSEVTLTFFIIHSHFWKLKANAYKEFQSLQKMLEYPHQLPKFPWIYPLIYPIE